MLFNHIWNNMKTTKIKMKRVSGTAILSTNIGMLGKVVVSFGDIIPDKKNVFDYKKYKPILLSNMF